MQHFQLIDEYLEEGSGLLTYVEVELGLDINVKAEVMVEGRLACHTNQHRSASENK